MKRRIAGWLAATALFAGSGAALGCADVGCEGAFNFDGRGYSCRGMGMLAPSNDSRINLMFLLADRGGRSTAGLSYPGNSYNIEQYGQVFLDWASLREALYPSPEDGSASADYSGSRCMSYAAGSTAIDAAMGANRALPAGERQALMAARGAAEQVCKTGTAYDRRYTDPAKLPPLPVYGGWPTVASRPGQDFLGYLKAADAFYGERWDAARQGFAGLAGAGDPRVRESAAYNLVRVEFSAAQAPAFGKYGDYDGAKVDRAAVKRGLLALAAYLKAWPTGRYATSAQGLLRRGLWLAGDYDGLGAAYARMLDAASPQQETAAQLVEEIDTKILFNNEAGGRGAQGPLLLAAQDLTAMRGAEDGRDAPALSAAALDAQASSFAGRTDLFAFLQATHAYYYARDYRRVLQLLPDDAKRPSYSNLAFSRQVLRGMALAAAGDRNEAGFWQELLGGAKGLWQRPLAELGLAMNWERHGKVDAVFAAGSPITDPTLRNELIVHSAGPALLRKIATDRGIAAKERDSALYTLLSNELGRGQFAQFAADTALPLAGSEPSAAVFTKGKVSDGAYGCAPIAVTARALAANPQDIPGRLCLGDFFRINGQGDVGLPDDGPPKDALGGFAKGFTGKILARADFYDAVIASPATRPDDKAYALYRAVMCYAPSGYSECGGAEAPKSQRKAWYDRLKRDYPQSPWAKKLRYYW